MTISPLERYHGSLLGLAVGDALGVPLEFMSPGTFNPVHAMIGGGMFGLKPGEWTDDTSMALCLAESLIQCSGFDLNDQLERYCDWYRNGHLSSNGKNFDIGTTTLSALLHFEKTGEPKSGPTDPRSAGNGSLMRLAPIPLAYAGTPSCAIELSGENSKATHPLDLCVDACRYMGGLIVGAVRGTSKEELLSSQFSPVEGYWDLHPLAPEICTVADGSFWEKEPPEIRGRGHVVDSLEAALWAFARTESFEEGCLAAVNLGDDADTTGAIYGQLAGAYYGVTAIPDGWKETIVQRETIEQFANDLFRIAGRL
ncbi:ADP-ribosylglycohydrolase family protein [Methanosphaerula palustris]|uniref:ADP-ribosylation/Crystallin J1 n=1 Tax=Methanosphaerula palustris (strain ATCC BAA-1556 / DSM 19958 / E1-9c) TaxID=521011 RepID=B8GER4_METPE|nr:ADP-ribosylglycohydrolase family protein [Methanosphaerula palustris]ACL17765.1 ADP-ribosylation/Crystallin J1 [Methanosphaerula palustris E1-9c]